MHRQALLCKCEQAKGKSSSPAGSDHQEPCVEQHVAKASKEVGRGFW